MPTDNKLWIPPLSPKAQKKTNRRHRGQKVLNRFSGFGKRFVRWFSFSGKTFWDILGIIAIPVVIAVVTMQFTAQQSQLSTQASDKQHQTDIQIAKDQQRETTLQTYLNDMSDLLLNHNLGTSKPEDKVSLVARERTLTSLQRLDARHNRILLQFLQDAYLIGVKNTVISLSNADLDGDDLSGANLRGADLRGVNPSVITGSIDFDSTSTRQIGTILRDADLSYADLSGANLDDADLRYAFLSHAQLSHAFLFNANLVGANLAYADLSYVDLIGDDLSYVDLHSADLRGARLGNMSHADLSGADLRGADLGYFDLGNTYLKGATMPDGSKHP